MVSPNEKFTINSYLEHSEIYGVDRECEVIAMLGEGTLQVTSSKEEITLGESGDVYDIYGPEGKIRITVSNDSDSYVFGCMITSKLRTQEIIFDEGIKYDRFFRSYPTQNPILSLNGSTKRYVMLKMTLNDNKEDATLIELDGETFEHTVEFTPGNNQLLIEATNRRGEIEEFYYNFIYYDTPFEMEPIQETIEMLEQGVNERSVRLDFYINRPCEGWLNGEKMISDKKMEIELKQGGWI